MATSMYAPLGTAMSLGDYVRVTRTFLEMFKAVQLSLPDLAPSRDMTGQKVSGQLQHEDVVKLNEDLQVSQRLIVHYTISLLRY
jgi:glycerol-3-phosphate O-acyltransferase/dihydroxyacetone phosphate acyltransferase